MNKKKKVLLPMLQTLKEMRPAHRSIILSHLDEESCDALYETVANVIRNDKLTEKTRKKLKKALSPHQKDVRYIADTTKPKNKRRSKLIQIGGFPLAAILSAAIPLLLHLFTKK